jgi:alkanesulfonate monooxygenase SsuD/methylene tetrahydromethanopterin reductase-like flavin-dependent oxidoreductase (luciferase family)
MAAVTEDDRDARIAALKGQIAFYGSTPAYRPVLEHHGWSALGQELHAMSRRGEWAAMGGLVDDDVLRAFAIVGSPREVAAGIAARYGGLVDRLQIAIGGDNARAAELLDAVRAPAVSG